MGRAKQYDRNELVDRAMALFHRSGFNGTSTAELVTALGVNRKSMYAEFGSKQGLFEAAMKRYDEVQLSAALAPIEEEGAGVEGIRRAFANYAAASSGRMRGMGCFLCNTAVERGALDPASWPYVQAYLDRVTRAFRHALGNARCSGDLGEAADVDALAAFFTTALVGVAASVRAEAPPTQVHAACRLAVSILDSHR